VSEVFVAIQRGVYRHEIIGVFTALDAAIEAAKAAVTAEHDHYHDVEICRERLDDGAAAGALVGSVKSIWVGGDLRNCRRPDWQGTEWVPEP
jgi:xanthine/CO dehydrogenase XdhC/CoxF family maturation factor